MNAFFPLGDFGPASRPQREFAQFSVAYCAPESERQPYAIEVAVAAAAVLVLIAMFALADKVDSRVASIGGHVAANGPPFSKEPREV